MGPVYHFTIGQIGQIGESANLLTPTSQRSIYKYTSRAISQTFPVALCFVHAVPRGVHEHRRGATAAALGFYDCRAVTSVRQHMRAVKFSRCRAK
jgi:hypothetical protein